MTFYGNRALPIQVGLLEVICLKDIVYAGIDIPKRNHQILTANKKY